MRADAILLLLGLLVPLIVIAFNILLKNIVQFLFEWVGYGSRTNRIKQIMSVVFILYFFNTGLSILLTNK